MKGECKDREQTCENRGRGNRKRTETKWGTDRHTDTQTGRGKEKERKGRKRAGEMKGQYKEREQTCEDKREEMGSGEG